MKLLDLSLRFLQTLHCLFDQLLPISLLILHQCNLVRMNSNRCKINPLHFHNPCMSFPSVAYAPILNTWPQLHESFPYKTPRFQIMFVIVYTELKSYVKQHLLYFLPLPHGQESFRPTLLCFCKRSSHNIALELFFLRKLRSTLNNSFGVCPLFAHNLVLLDKSVTKLNISSTCSWPSKTMSI